MISKVQEDNSFYQIFYHSYFHFNVLCAQVCSTPIADMTKISNKMRKISAAVSLSSASFVAPSFAISEAINETASMTPSLKNTLLSVVA